MTVDTTTPDEQTPEQGNEGKDGEPVARTRTRTRARAAAPPTPSTSEAPAAPDTAAAAAAAPPADHDTRPRARARRTTADTKPTARRRKAAVTDPGTAEVLAPVGESPADAPDDVPLQPTPKRGGRRTTRAKTPAATVDDGTGGTAEEAAPSPRAAAEAVAAAEDTTVIRRRRRRRAGDGEGTDAVVTEVKEVSDEPAETEVKDVPDEAAETEVTDVPPEAVETEADDDTDTAVDTPGDDTDEGSGGRPSRARRRGGRGRGRRSRGGGRDEAEAVPDAEAGSAPAAAPTRLQARGRRAGGRAGVTADGRQRGRPGRGPLGGVSEETRRAIADGPPRTMLVTVGQERTQIAVLEERSLVEHYVTRREDVSYVGNIYLGRVQNVLPGMEAAFVDVGKGRNGVLYAGEVNYDEADLDGELPRIEQTLKPGQSVLVQVTKDPMGTKGARLTQHLSIAGRYCVLAPGDGMLGISRKLADEERERLRKILKSIKPDGYGLIVRTAAEGATKEQLEADVSRLERIWEQVNARIEKVKPLEGVYEEPDLVIRVIRDVFGPEYEALVVDSAELAEQIRAYLADVSPELVDRVSVYGKPAGAEADQPAGAEADQPAGAEADQQPLFDGYEVTNQIRRALEKKVWLASGGYLIVEKIEAMWVIDVNTGRFVGKSNLEETVLKNNLEAATEIARQLRLRDMGGIIVIDFVDMLVPANRDEVLKRFKRELARDRTKSRVMEISKLGLVQMTRKNVSQGLQESFTIPCDHCEGRGSRIVDALLA